MIGIRREDKNEWERRAPLVPDQVRGLAAGDEAPDFAVQPSAHRAFDDGDDIARTLAHVVAGGIRRLVTQTVTKGINRGDRETVRQTIYVTKLLPVAQVREKAVLQHDKRAVTLDLVVNAASAVFRIWHDKYPLANYPILAL